MLWIWTFIKQNKRCSDQMHCWSKSQGLFFCQTPPAIAKWTCLWWMGCRCILSSILLQIFMYSWSSCSINEETQLMEQEALEVFYSRITFKMLHQHEAYILQELMNDLAWYCMECGVNPIWKSTKSLRTNLGKTFEDRIVFFYLYWELCYCSFSLGEPMPTLTCYSSRCWFVW